MPESSIKLRFAKKVRAKDMVALYKDAGWWDEKFTLEWIQPLVRNSFLFAGAFEGPRLVGMARALSDGVSDAYILDVVVLKAYRKRGLAKALVRLLVEELKSRGVDWTVCIAAPGSLNFYKKTGGRVMKGHVPIRFGEED